MDDALKLVVLGAGASAHCGYPMAQDFFPRLKAYGESLSEDCTKLRSAIRYVVSEAEASDALTVDDLARLALLRRGGGMENYRKAWRTVSLARIATDAFFLRLESGVERRVLEPIKNLWHEILGASTDQLAHDFPITNYRLISFNYDRLPEIAFARFFTTLSYPQFDPYSTHVLNTGLNEREGPNFKEDTFCYLKLHGSVGVRPLGQNEIDRSFGHFFAHYSPFSQSAGLAKVTDATYFKDELDADGLPLCKFVPLIVFPADKQRVEAGGEDYNLKEYINAIRDKARQLFRAARQVRVIGYSFHVADKEWLISLLRSAPDAKKIIINPHAEEICHDLRVYDDLKNLEPVQRKWG